MCVSEHGISVRQQLYFTSILVSTISSDPKKVIWRVEEQMGERDCAAESSEEV